MCPLLHLNSKSPLLYFNSKFPLSVSISSLPLSIFIPCLPFSISIPSLPFSISIPSSPSPSPFQVFPSLSPFHVSRLHLNSKFPPPLSQFQVPPPPQLKSRTYNTSLQFNTVIQFILLLWSVSKLTRCTSCFNSGKRRRITKTECKRTICRSG